jgi:hypothetical protein
MSDNMFLDEVAGGRRHPLNLRHIVVKKGLVAAIIPFDGYAHPILF